MLSYFDFSWLMFALPLGSMRGSSSSSPRMAASSSSEISTSRMCAAGIAAGLAFAVPFLSAAAGDRLADFALSLPDAAGAVFAVAEMRHVELRQREC